LKSFTIRAVNSIIDWKILLVTLYIIRAIQRKFKIGSDNRLF